jgi:hypothetical protein
MGSILYLLDALPILSAEGFPHIHLNSCRKPLLRGGCRREAIVDEESIAYRRGSVRNLLILRRGNFHPDRLRVRCFTGVGSQIAKHRKDNLPLGARAPILGFQ